MYDDAEALLDLQFQLEEGKHLAILRESGCGKSTRLKIIYETLQPNKGKISWKNQPMLGPEHNLMSVSHL